MFRTEFRQQLYQHFHRSQFNVELNFEIKSKVQFKFCMMFIYKISNMHFNESDASFSIISMNEIKATQLYFQSLKNLMKVKPFLDKYCTYRNFEINSEFYVKNEIIKWWDWVESGERLIRYKIFELFWLEISRCLEIWLEVKPFLDEYYMYQKFKISFQNHVKKWSCQEASLSRIESMSHVIRVFKKIFLFIFVKYIF